MLAQREPETKAPQALPMSHYSPEMEMLMRICDRLGEVIQAQIAAAGGRPPKITPLPRPVTALERMRDRQRWSKHKSLAARVLPHKYADGAAPAPAPVPKRPTRPPSAGVKLRPGQDPRLDTGRG